MNNIKKIIKFCKKNNLSFVYDYKSNELMFYKDTDIYSPYEPKNGFLLITEDYFKNLTKNICIVDWLKEGLKYQRKMKNDIHDIFTEFKTKFNELGKEYKPYE